MERRAGRPGLARAGGRSRHRETAWSAGKPGGVRGRPNALVYGRRLSSWVERPGIGNDASDPGGPTLQSPYNRGCILHFFLRHDFCLSFPQAMVAPRATRPQLHTLARSWEGREVIMDSAAPRMTGAQSTGLGLTGRFVWRSLTAAVVVGAAVIV